jgi:hypothetical protein
MLNLYGRGATTGTSLTPSVKVARTIDVAGGNPAVASFGNGRHEFRSEPSFGFDAQVIAGRWLSFMKNDGETENARFDMLPSGTTSFIPDNTRIGSATAAGFGSDSAVLLSPRLGSDMASHGDFAARALALNVVTLNNQSGAVTLNLALGSIFVVNLTGNVTSLAFSNALYGGQVPIIIHFQQDATGSRTLAGTAASIKLAGGALILSTGANKRDIITLTTDGGSYWETARSLNLG